MRCLWRHCSSEKDRKGLFGGIVGYCLHRRRKLTRGLRGAYADFRHQTPKLRITGTGYKQPVCLRPYFCLSDMHVSEVY